MIYKFNEYNEMKMGTINFSDLADNWSSEFNLSSEIKTLKIEYKKLGRDGSIKKIINIIEKLDKSNYDSIKKSIHNKYKISLPEYKRAISNEYWHSRYSTISKIIIMLEVVSSGIESEKLEILNKIENFNQNSMN